MAINLSSHGRLGNLDAQVYEFNIPITASLRLKLRLSRGPSGAVLHSSRLTRDAGQPTNGDRDLVKTPDQTATSKDSARSEATSEISHVPGGGFIRIERVRASGHTNIARRPQYGEQLPSSHQGQPIDAWLAQDTIEDPYNAVECVVGPTITASRISLPDDGVPSDTGATFAGDEEQEEVSLERSDGSLMST